LLLLRSILPLLVVALLWVGLLVRWRRIGWLLVWLLIGLLIGLLIRWWVVSRRRVVGTMWVPGLVVPDHKVDDEADEAEEEA
jgi:hypothetical protein